MDWWNDLGAYAGFFGSTPALAVDFATNGPNPDMMGFNSAYALQTTQADINVYDQAMQGG